MAYSEQERTEALALWFALEGTMWLEDFVAELDCLSCAYRRG